MTTDSYIANAAADRRQAFDSLPVRTKPTTLEVTLGNQATAHTMRRIREKEEKDANADR